MYRFAVILLAACLGASVLLTPSPGRSQENACVSIDGRRSDNEVWTTNSWAAFNHGDHAGAAGNVNACMSTWAEAAAQMQEAMSSCPSAGAATPAQQAVIHRNGVLNDVATNYWILARSLELQGDRRGARDAYQRCAALTCARTWDPRGWFWDPAADCARRQRQLD